MKGFKILFNDSVITVWSAPNYCYRCGNKASILELDEEENQNFIVFDAAEKDIRSEYVKKDLPEYFL